METVKMWRSFFFILLLYSEVQAQSLTRYVQPLSGTAASTTISARKHSEAGSKESNANTIPAVGTPLGMTQWTPQTRTTEIKCQPPYYFRDSLLSGFRATHWISGSCTQDYGSFTIVPVSGSLRTAVNEYSIPFSHADEVSGPSYYKVDLPAAGLVAELTATARCGVLRFTMTRDDSLYLLFISNSDFGKGKMMTDSAMQVISGNNPVHRIYQGWGQEAGFSGWLYAVPDKKFSLSGNFTTTDKAGSTIAGAYIGYALKKGDVITVKAGTSFTSIGNARGNYRAEVAGYSFSTVEKRVRQQWESALGRIRADGGTESEKRIFYTALYHSLQHPRLMSDVNGTYPQFAGNKQTGKLKTGGYFDDFSMWDTYRAQLPLLEITHPRETTDFLRSLVLKAQQGGWMPIFPCWNSYTAAMIGDHAAAYIAAAYAKGFRGFNADTAWKYIRQNAFTVPATYEAYKNGMGRRALISYMQYGYIPVEDSVPEAFHKKEQVSRTLEYAYDDYAAAVMALRMNKKADAAVLRQRAFSYSRVFDSTAGMVRGKHADGRFTELFTPDTRTFYITEGTARQYTFYVPHDIKGLARLMGGEQALEAALDSLFEKGEYWHGNEPGHQIPFLYNFTRAPWKTQFYVKKILDEEYSDGPGGLSGNDDAGQMSAWYVFAAMGFYPVNPASGQYLLCTPRMDSVSIRSGKTIFRIVTRRNRRDDPFIAAVKWNGKPYTKNYITWNMIRRGGVLEIITSAEPGNFGAGATARPGSLSDK